MVHHLGRLISGMRTYHTSLSRGFATAKVKHTRGHDFTSHDLGATGIKNRFDNY